VTVTNVKFNADKMYLQKMLFLL